MVEKYDKVKYTPGKTDGEKMLVACARCACDTKHAVLTSINEQGSSPWHGGDDYHWGADYQIIQCQGCETISFRKESSNSEDYDEDYESNVQEDLYPSRTNNWQLLKDDHLLPMDLGRIYRETVVALNTDQPVLSGIGIRAIIETVSNEKKAPGKNLAQKIDGLVLEGLLTADGAKILHKIRALGNESAHSVKAHGATELKLAMDVVEHLLKAVYVLPHHAKSTFK